MCYCAGGRGLIHSRRVSFPHCHQQKMSNLLYTQSRVKCSAVLQTLSLKNYVRQILFPEVSIICQDNDNPLGP